MEDVSLKALLATARLDALREAKAAVQKVVDDYNNQGGLKYATAVEYGVDAIEVLINPPPPKKTKAERIAEIIRKADGSHTLGASALADAIVAEIGDDD